MTDSYLPVRTATAAHVVALRTELASAGHQVVVLAPQSHALHVHDRAFHPVPALSFPGGHGQLVFPALSQADRLLARANLVHIHSAGALGRWVADRAVKRRTPFVYTIHPEALRPPAGNSTAFTVAAQAALTLVPTTRVAADLAAAGVLRPVLVIPPGIDTAFFRHGDAQTVRRRLCVPADTPFLLAVGRLEPTQHFELILRAVAQLQEHPHLAIVGTGPNERPLRSLITGLGVTDRVHLVGEVPHAQMPAYYAAATAFVTATPDDPAPMSILEAQAAGCPVIAVRTTATAELVHDHTDGFLVRPTKTALATAVRQLLHRPTLRHTLSLAARRTAAPYDMDAVTERIEDAYTLTRTLTTVAR